MKPEGIMVLLLEKVQIGVDEFGAPINEDVWVTVNNVLVSPVSAEDVATDLSLYGKKAVYELGIPKGDSHNWEDTEVIIFGKTFRTFGPEIQGIDKLIPLNWNKKIKVERYG